MLENRAKINFKSLSIAICNTTSGGWGVGRHVEVPDYLFYFHTFMDIIAFSAKRRLSADPAGRRAARDVSDLEGGERVWQ